MSDYTLSILVCGLYERRGLPLLDDLDGQANNRAVELLTLYDNRAMTVGRKRTILLSMAKGEYFAFVDDDDTVAPDYVARLLTTIEANPGVDVITFGQKCVHADTGMVERCRYGLTMKYHTWLPDESKPLLWNWEGLPAHTMCWRTDLVQDIPFPDGNFGEDVGWVKRACGRAKAEVEIPACLYTYQFDPERSRTRGR
jgi:hypothetical protein